MQLTRIDALLPLDEAPFSSDDPNRVPISVTPMKCQTSLKSSLAASPDGSYFCGKNSFVGKIKGRSVKT